ncbi:heparinase II/III family protein [Porticoccaceae bacterium]|nr:heparinase II/III family protein [Porticoccaceae bacterium]
MDFVFIKYVVGKPAVLARMFKRVKGKSIRDFVVYFRRKGFLCYVKFVNRYCSSEYFFSKLYKRKFIEYGDLPQGSAINRSGGIFGDIEAVRERLSVWKSRHPDEFGAQLRQANRFLAHEFDLLGSGPVNLSFPCKPTGIFGIKYHSHSPHEPVRDDLLSSGYKCIDWHIDFRSGYRWNPDQYYPSSRSYVQTPGADIKMPWELSRCQHLPLLATTYLATNDVRFAEEIINEIVDWISNNPLCKGPNWNCPMDVAIRISNWFVAIELLGDFRSDDHENFCDKFISSSLQHFDYLRNNFEWTSKLTSNHYLSDIAGFAFCAHYIPYLKNRKIIKNFVKNEFLVELKKQMNTEGMNCEGSLSYHRLVIEIFSYVAMLDNKSFLESELSYHHNLNKCFDFTQNVLRPDASIPQIGDNDSGLFLKLSSKSLSDMNYLFAIGARLFPSSGFMRLINPSSLEAVIHGVNVVKKEPKFHNKEITIYKESGIAVTKHKETYISFYFGDNGQNGNGGHCHNDRLSFTVWHKGEEIFLDPGTGVYTSFPEVRNHFRSTSMHNTVSIMNKEQNRMPADGYLFGVREDISKISFACSQTSNSVEYLAAHNGYRYIQDDLLHKRKLEYQFDNNIIFINDFIGDDVEGVAYFLLRNDHNLEIIEDGVHSDLFSMTFDGHINVEKGLVPLSRAYGSIKNNECIRVAVSFLGSLQTNIKLN